MQPIFRDDLYNHTDSLSREIRAKLYGALKLECHFHQLESTLPQHWRDRCDFSFSEHVDTILSELDLLLMGPDMSDPVNKDNASRIKGQPLFEQVPLFTTISTVQCQIDRSIGAYKAKDKVLLYLMDGYLPFARVTKGKVLKSLPPIQKISFLMTGEGNLIGAYLGQEFESFIPSEQLLRSDTGALKIYFSKDTHYPYHLPPSKNATASNAILWEPTFSEDVGLLPQEYSFTHKQGLFSQFLSILALPFTSVASLFRQRHLRVLSTETEAKMPLYDGPLSNPNSKEFCPQFQQRRLPLVSAHGAEPRLYMGTDFQEDALSLHEEDLKHIVSSTLK